MKVVRYKTQDGVFTAILVKTGRRFSQVILMDSAGIRIRKVPKAEERYMTEIGYSIAKAKRKFRDAAKRFNEGPLPNALREALS